MPRKFYWLWAVLCLCALPMANVHAETYQLGDGRTLNGEILPDSADESGIQIRLDEGKHERITWETFSQEDLKRFARDTKYPKMARFAEPYLEVSQEERQKRLEVEIKTDFPRLKRPAAHSLIGALFSSSVGVIVLALLYAANLYAAYEIAIFRARPKAVVCGVSAAAPFIGPIVFLCLPSPKDLVAAGDVPPQAPGVVQPAFRTPAAPAAEAAGGLRLAASEAGQPATETQTQVFQRGPFTFNRRFFETKFPGFFGVIRRSDADKDQVLVIQSARGHFTAQRISRISTNELHVQIHRGGTSEEVLIPFSEIYEVQVRNMKA